MAKQHDLSLKHEVLTAIKNGTSVADICAQKNLSVKTAYRWLRHQVDNTGTSALALARLRKENQELKELVGWFALEKKRAEKNRQGA